MNFEELKNKRRLEIKEGKHLATRGAIYCIIDPKENYCDGHSEITLSTSLSGKDKEWGYIDRSLDSEDIEFCTSKKGMKKPEAVTRFYTDRYVSFHLTSESAYNYKLRQKHNMSDLAFVYVHCEGYANYEIERLFDKEPSLSH